MTSYLAVFQNIINLLRLAVHNHATVVPFVKQAVAVRNFPLGLMALRFPVAPIKRIDGFFLDSQTKDAFVAKASGQWVQPFDIYQFFCNQFPQA